MRYTLPAISLLLYGIAIATAIPAAAQSPTADQLIQALKPGASSTTSRGIRQISPGAATPAPSANTTASGAARPVVAGSVSAGPSVNLTVNFVSGSADLSPQALRTLDELGRALTNPALAGFRFRIEGHTDTVGTPEANKALSERRATAVLDYLNTKWSIDKARIDAVGMGEEQLLIKTGPNVAQPQNRRVTVINIGS